MARLKVTLELMCYGVSVLMGPHGFVLEVNDVNDLKGNDLQSI